MVRKYLVIVALGVCLLAAVACADDATNVAPTASPFRERIPEPIAALPEGSLIVQDENPIGYPRLFAVSVAESKQIGKGPSVSVSPDGRTLAAIEYDAENYRWQIRMLSSTGEELAVVEAPSAGAALNAGLPYLHWSPDGDRLSYTLADGPDKGHVYIMNRDGSSQRRLTSEAGYYASVGWTADGRLLVSDAGTTLVAIGEASEKLRLPPDRGPAAFTISSDGKKVAIQAGDYEHGLELWLIDLETGSSRLLADMGGNVRHRGHGLYVSAGVPPHGRLDSTYALFKGPPPVAWSPDSARIAYYRSLVGPGDAFSSELRVVDLQSGEDIGVTEEGSWQAAWSPDGRYLVEPTESALVLHDTQGETRRLEMRYAKQVSWSGSGVLVAIAAGGVSLIDPETGAVISAVTDDGRPAYGGNAAYGSWVWSPSERYLAFSTISDIYTKGSVQVLDSVSGAVTLVLNQQSFVPVGWLAGD